MRAQACAHELPAPGPAPPLHPVTRLTLRRPHTPPRAWSAVLPLPVRPVDRHRGGVPRRPLPPLRRFPQVCGCVVQRLRVASLEPGLRGADTPWVQTPPGQAGALEVELARNHRSSARRRPPLRAGNPDRNSRIITPDLRAGRAIVHASESGLPCGPGPAGLGCKCKGAASLQGPPMGPCRALWHCARPPPNALLPPPPPLSNPCSRLPALPGPARGLLRIGSMAPGLKASASKSRSPPRAGDAALCAARASPPLTRPIARSGALCFL